MATDLVDRARSAVQDRAELPGMSLMEHLEELRKRIFWSVGYLAIGMVIAYAFHVRIIAALQKPLTDVGQKMTMTHPTDSIDILIKSSAIVGAILASPFILYQIWLFISPGMYTNEKKYVWPFMGATVGLFLSGSWFGYRYVLPGAMKVLLLEIGKDYNHMITIDEYTGFFLAVILGLGITFELPVLIFFLALFGIVDGKFLLKHFRYAILAIFLIAAIICPTPEPIGMCLFASPMLALYFLGVAVAFLVHPTARNKRKQKKEGA
ncbi:twin-arginine translocase subunit TatC [Granulicella sp. S156]|jgi:sec-independent protein translocase protein TatC|uniref:twin-arginine translocase subunit TatC n=1 Tax=Granulicella sp. S156 TaxID=1747224 RepID=UPI00131C635F|nr:twin-arginine translocase subunit TatC [Granulicella sp. S156]